MEAAACWTVLMFFFVMAATGVSGGRSKRHLSYPKGTSFTVSIATSTFLPKDLPQGFGHILEIDFGYPFPEKFAIDKPVMVKKKNKPQTTIWYYPLLTRKTFQSKGRPKRRRQKRSLKDRHRKHVASQVDAIITRLGYDGSSCVARLQCEVRHLSRGSSFLEDILLIWFTNSSYGSSECESFKNSCPFSLLQMILHSETAEEN